jgi:hypothetical protein
MNFYEEELLKVLNVEILANKVIVSNDCLANFTELASFYPNVGSQIDWSAFPDAIVSHEPKADIQAAAFAEFFGRIFTQFDLGGYLIYMGDGVTDFVLTSEAAVFSKYLKEIFSIPQHHYFVAKDYSWCMVFSFEGDMSFTFVKKSD